ncbi:MAG: penicillin-binding protein activator [Halieaceae bacterium]|jgi:outer membrane PBP1 activator LpoA protein|nr:penicillin-binding protein activator [Halieaceae bacterium]
MRDNLTSRFHGVARLGTCLVLLGLWGCGSEPVKAPEPEPEPPVVAQPPPAPVRAALTLPPSSYSAQFARADQLLADKQWMAASDVLASIPPNGRSPSDAVYITYLQARIDYIRGEQGQALALLDSLERPGIDPAQRYRILNLRRYILQMSGDYLESARLGDEALRMAPPTDAPALQRSIWQDLQRIDTEQLEQAAGAAVDARWQVWLELALLTRAPLAAQLQSLPLWLQTNPQHPAANPLPGGLGYLLNPPPGTQKVALILPLSGRLAAAGRAVRDGYLAGYYAARESGSPPMDVMVLDQDAYGSASAAYDAALAQGASIVVGPLSKEAVAELSSRPDRTVPVLALNRLDAEEITAPGSSALVQFALAPEDEARDVARLAFGQGARTALILRPAGDWGSKVAEALIERWQELGGHIANSVTYNDREDYSDSVKEALGIPASEQRAQEIRDILGAKLEFNARRRQDVDVIFLLSSNGAEARSLKPLLAFHYAASVPVYAISSIYSGVPDPRDRDLDGVRFVEMPWLLGGSAGLKTAIAAGNTGSDSYTRLNALGADAYLLQSQFLRLQAGADALFRGSTGLLSMDPQLRIERDLVLVKFDDGAVEPQ